MFGIEWPKDLQMDWTVDWTGIVGTALIVACVIAFCVIAQVKAKPDNPSVIRRAQDDSGQVNASGSRQVRNADSRRTK